MNPLQQCLHDVKQAINDPSDAWRLAGLATIDQHGHPQVRQVVLREVNTEAAHILVYTDRRSQKVFELQQQPACALLLWCPTRHQQLRLSCRARTLKENAKHWAKIEGRHSVNDYASIPAPGEDLLAPLQFDQANARDHFVVMVLQVLEIDRLWLSRKGHRRQRLSADGEYEIAP